MRFGFQVSITKSLDEVIKRAVERNCQTLQIFTRNPRSWMNPREFPQHEIKEFQTNLKKTNITPLIVHLPYLPNLATLDKRLFMRSVDVLISDLEQAAILGATYLIVHLGNHVGNGVQKGIEQVIEALNRALLQVNNEVILLLENQAGAGTEIGYNFTHLKKILENVIPIKRVGICLDICHAFASGYELSNIKGVNKTIDLFNHIIGIDKLAVVHLSDSKTDLGSKVDRHAHIGAGKIGLSGISAIVNHPALIEKPVILETPIKTIEDDIRNLKLVEGLRRY